MFFSINRLSIKPGCGPQLEERFAKSSGLEQMDGFISFRLLQRTWHPHGDEANQTEEYLAMTQWRSEADFQAWIGSPAFKAAHSGPKLEIFAGPGQPAGYQVAIERLPQTQGA